MSNEENAKIGRVYVKGKAGGNDMCDRVSITIA